MLGLGDQERRARTSQSMWFLGRRAGGTQSPCSRQTTSTLRQARLQAIAPPAAPAPMIRTSRSSSCATAHFLLQKRPRELSTSATTPPSPGSTGEGVGGEGQTLITAPR